MAEAGISFEIMPGVTAGHFGLTVNFNNGCSVSASAINGPTYTPSNTPTKTQTPTRTLTPTAHPLEALATALTRAAFR